MEQILCTHECVHRKLFQEQGEKSIKENGGGGEFKYDIL
jgi:hypothetical protein